MVNKYRSIKPAVSSRVVTHGLVPTANQLSTITFLQTSLDKTIDLTKPNRKKSPYAHDNVATFRMSGRPWALKNPTGSSPRTLQRAIRDASRCSHHVVIDLGNTDISDDVAIMQLTEFFDIYDSIEDLLIVTSQAKLVEYHKS